MNKAYVNKNLTKKFISLYHECLPIGQKQVKIFFYTSFISVKFCHAKDILYIENCIISVLKKKKISGKLSDTFIDSILNVKARNFQT